MGVTTLVGASVQIVGSLSAAALALRPFTILRTRMVLLFSSDQAGVSERPNGGYGHIIVTDAASAIGATAVPDPSSTTGNPEADWYVHTQLVVDFQFLSAVGFDGAAGMRYDIDSKAMRKVGPDDDQMLVSSMDAGTGAILYTGGRQLIQLH